MSSERFASLIHSNPDNQMFRFSYGEALFAEEKFKECLEHLEFCVGKNQNRMIPHILLGKALIALDRKSEAIPHLVTALALAKEQNHEDPETEIAGLLKDLG